MVSIYSLLQNAIPFVIIILNRPIQSFPGLLQPKQAKHHNFQRFLFTKYNFYGKWYLIVKIFLCCDEKIFIHSSEIALQCSISSNAQQVPTLECGVAKLIVESNEKIMREYSIPTYRYTKVPTMFIFLKGVHRLRTPSIFAHRLSTKRMPPIYPLRVFLCNDCAPQNNNAEIACPMGYERYIEVI